ncbi:hypothetical protein TNCV_1655441 [Trichonephila clavipes]|nr:hypothetical protein TNCV_1655441 [Trichonephila clavipes]
MWLDSRVIMATNTGPERHVSSLMPMKTLRAEEEMHVKSVEAQTVLVGVIFLVWRRSARSSAIQVILPRFKIMMSVANNPRVAL